MNRLNITPESITGYDRHFDLDGIAISDNKPMQYMLLRAPLYVNNEFSRHEFLYGRNDSPVRRRINGEMVFQYVTTEDAVRKWNGFEYALVEGDYVRDKDGNLVENPDWATGIGEYDFLQNTPLTGPYGAAKLAQATQIILQLVPLGRYDT